MYILKSAVSTFLLLLPAFLFAQSPDPAMKLLEMKQYNKAKSAFIGNLKSRNSVSDWYYLEKIYIMQNQVDSAKYCCSQLTAANPKSILVQLAQALIDLSSGNQIQALNQLDKTQKNATSAKDVGSLTETGLLRFQAGDTAGWILPLSLASQIDPKNPLPYTTAGHIYLLMSDQFKQQRFIGLASGRYEQALYNDPGNLEAGTNEAGLFMRGGNYSEAEEYLDRVLSKDSNYIPALQIYGELSFQRGSYEKASLLFGRYMAIAEFNDKDLFRYITILYFNREFKKADTLLSPVLDTEPANAVLLRLKAYIAYELGNYAEGMLAIKKFFDLRADADTSKIIPTDYEYAGKLFSQTGNDSLGIVYLEKAIEMDPTRIALFEDISRSYEKQKKYLEAVSCYDKLIAYRNGNVSLVIYFNKGKDLLLLANEVVSTSDSLQRPLYLANAASAFSKLIELSPNSHLGYLWHARTAAATDPETTLGLAKADYEKTISILEQKTDREKYRTDLIEGYRYMGYYTYLQYDSAKTNKNNPEKEQYKILSLGYWQKVLGLDPENEVAKKAINALK